MIKAVIFDFGGTIRHSYHRGIEPIAKAYGISQKKLLEIIPQYLDAFSRGRINEDKFWQQLSLALNKSIPNNKYQVWRKPYEEGFYMYPEILDYVKKLKKEGIKIAVLSNVIPPHAKIIKKHDGYKGFDVLVLSYKVGLRKPEKNIYTLVLEKLKVKAQSCIFIDDIEDNLVPARELGMKTVLAKNHRQVIHDVQSLIEQSIGKW